MDTRAARTELEAQRAHSLRIERIRVAAGLLLRSDMDPGLLALANQFLSRELTPDETSSQDGG